MAKSLRYKILIGDSDPRIGSALKGVLAKMGFTDSRLVTNGDDAFSAVQSERFDIMLTDWVLKGSDGEQLMRRLRRDSRSVRPALPVMLVSGMADEPDVLLARDNGVNEYLKKPFTAYTLFNGLERLICLPRPFIQAFNYAGPCRRGRSNKPLVERRRVQPQQRIGTPGPRIMKPGEAAAIFKPDMTLQKRLMPETRLAKVVDICDIDAAQATLEATADEALPWIREDLRHLNIFWQAMAAGEWGPFQSGEFTARALSIYTRAGIFGYEAISEIGNMLHSFSRNQLNPRESAQLEVTRKFLDIIQLLVMQGIKGLPDGEFQAIEKRLVRQMLESTTAQFMGPAALGMKK